MLGESRIVGFIPTSDYARAREFFEKKLGLGFISQDDFALVMDANGTMIRVTKVRDHKPLPFTILGWEVRDIDGVVGKLTKAGVTFERYGFFEQDPQGVWTAPGGDKVAWFKDPDGNTLSVSEHVGR